MRGALRSPISDVDEARPELRSSSGRGADRIYARGGDDVLCGGPGPDIIDGAERRRRLGAASIRLLPQHRSVVVEPAEPDQKIRRMPDVQAIRRP